MLFRCHFDDDAACWVAYQTTREGDQFAPPVTARHKDHALILLGRHWVENPGEEGVDFRPKHGDN